MIADLFNRVCQSVRCFQLRLTSVTSGSFGIEQPRRTFLYKAPAEAHICAAKSALDSLGPSTWGAQFHGEGAETCRVETRQRQPDCSMRCPAQIERQTGALRCLPSIDSNRKPVERLFHGKSADKQSWARFVATSPGPLQKKTNMWLLRQGCSNKGFTTDHPLRSFFLAPLSRSGLASKVYGKQTKQYTITLAAGKTPLQRN